MTIDRLSSLSAQLAALRAELARKGAGTARSQSNTGVADARPQRPNPDKQALKTQLIEIVGSVSPDDAVDADTLRRRIVGAVLQWEFGADLREHPEWRPMVDTIAETLANDPRSSAAIDSLIKDLQR